MKLRFIIIRTRTPMCKYIHKLRNIRIFDWFPNEPEVDATNVCELKYNLKHEIISSIEWKMLKRNVFNRT